ncbi:MAG: tetratricopeptide repeat protein [Acidobacteria bacterium]|nr:tetratricopeptide repeat protein [Acidobacteriota bacterium]
MGDVYLGVDLTLDRKVAVKVVRGETRLRQVYRDRLANEAKILSQLEHPNICRIYEFIAGDAFDLLVMELIQGQDLMRFLDTKPSLQVCLQIAIQIAEVLVVTHEQDIVHRDLKPQNIMVMPNQSIKVLDFGIARALSVIPDTNGIEQLEERRPARPVTGGILTRYGLVIGTPMYMSPEQAMGQEVSASSDLYSFGLVMQWLFTGQLPYGECNSLELVDKVTRGESREVTGIDSELMVLINRLKSHSPELRPTARDALIQLKWFAEKPKRRLKRMAVAGFVAVLLSGTILSTVGFIRARKAETTALAARNQAQAVNRFLEDMLAAADPENKGIDVKVVDVLEDARQRVDHEFKDNPLEQAAVMHTLAKTYYALGNYEASQDLAERSLEARSRLLGETHEDVIEAKLTLVAILNDGGKLEEATDLNSDLLRSLKGAHGEREKAMLKAQKLSAYINMNRGDYPQSEKQFFEVLARSKELLGLKDRETLIAMNGYAAVLLYEGRYREAQTAFQDYIDVSREVMGPDHLLTLTAEMNLASVFMYQHQNAEAESLYQDVRERMRKYLGEKHPKTIMAYQNMGALYLRRNMNAQAEQVLSEALALELEVFGEEHPTTLMTMQNLIAANVGLNRSDKAEKQARKVIAIQERVLGIDHPTTLIAKINLGEVLRNQGRYEEGVDWLQQVVKLAENKLGSDHPNTLQALLVLCFMYEDMHQYEKAVEVAHKVLLGRARGLGEKHVDTLQAEYSVGWNYSKLRDHEPAIKHLRRAYEGRREVLGPNDSSALASQSQLAWILRDHGDWAESRDLYADIVERKAAKLDRLDADLLVSLDQLAYTKMLLKEEGTVEMYRDIYSRSLEAFGPEHEKTELAESRLARGLNAYGFEEEAAVIRRKHIQRSRQQQGLSTHTLTLMNDAAWDFASSDRIELAAEAEALSREALDGVLKLDGDDTVLQRNLMDTLALSLEKQGQTEEAINWYRKAYAMGCKESGEALIRLGVSGI